jgi:dihydroflavonol-4-reductase
MAILVTGATGMVGAHILEKLIKEGKTTVAIKRANSSTDYVRRLFSYYNNNDFNKIIWRDADITDFSSIIEAFDDVEFVIHAAGMVSFDPKESKNVFTINATGTQNIVNACLEKGIKKLVYISSVAALGKTKPEVLINENTAWKDDNTQSPYSVSKYKAECEVWRGIEEGLNGIVLSPSIVIGPCIDNKSSGMLIKAFENGATFYTEGTFGFVDVRDVAAIAVNLLEKAINQERFIVSSENLGYRNVINLLCDMYGKKHPYIKANKLLLRIAVIFEWLKSKISGHTPGLTKYTISSSLEKNSYSNQKIIKELNYTFFCIKDAIGNSVNFRLN